MFRGERPQDDEARARVDARADRAPRDRLLAIDRGSAAAREPRHRRRRRKLTLTYTETNAEAKKRLYAKVKSTAREARHEPGPPDPPVRLHEERHPDRRLRPSGGHMSLRNRSGDIGPERRLPSARGRQPVRRRHELLPEHRRRQPGPDRDGELAPRRRPPARAVDSSDGGCSAPSGDSSRSRLQTSGSPSSKSAAGFDRTPSATRPDRRLRPGRDVPVRPWPGADPWPNRLRAASYAFGGRNLQLPSNEPGTGSAIHGLVRWALERGRARASTASSSARLHPHNPATCSRSRSGSNTRCRRMGRVLDDGDERRRRSVPFGAGATRIFRPGSPGRPRVAALPAQSVLQVDADGIPSPPPGRGDGVRLPAAEALGGTRLDHCFTDLRARRHGLTAPRSEHGGRRHRCDARVDEAYPYLMLYSGDDRPDVSRRSMAIEPMTCPPQAFRTGERRPPRAGRSFRGTWGLRRGRRGGGRDDDPRLESGCGTEPYSSSRSASRSSSQPLALVFCSDVDPRPTWGCDVMMRQTCRGSRRGWSKWWLHVRSRCCGTGAAPTFEFGLLGRRPPIASARSFGLLFALEGIFFFTEAIPLSTTSSPGRPPGKHLWTGVPWRSAVLGGAFSVVAVDSWMNQPQGFTLTDGRGDPVDR